MTEPTHPPQASTPPTGSVLSEAEVRELGIVLEPRHGGWRDCGYDLGAKYVIDSNGEDKELKPGEPFEIPAHGMVEVVAGERLRLPDDVVAYAMVKTGLTIEGIFALNIGIIDPAYDGNVSTTLINFGNSSRKLNSGDAFLRLTFHRLASPAKRKPKPIDFPEYLAIRKRKAKEHFSKTFLDMEGTAKAVSTELLGEWKKNLFVLIPLVAGFFAVLTLLFNVTALVLNLTTSNRHSVTDEDVHEICEDVASALGKQQQAALTPAQIASICGNQGPISAPPVPIITAPTPSVLTLPSAPVPSSPASAGGARRPAKSVPPASSGP